MIDLGVLLRVPCVEVEMGFDVSPDGEHVAFSWNPDGRWEIYEIPLSGGPSSAKRSLKTDQHRISYGSGAKFHPRYSPDGRQLAYAVDYDGSESFHLLVHDFGTGILILVKNATLLRMTIVPCRLISPGRQIANRLLFYRINPGNLMFISFLLRGVMPGFYWMLASRHGR
jgi:hypothetical protein